MERAALSVVTKFGVLLVDELQEIRGVRKIVVHLMDELDTMNAVLRMLSEADESTVDHLVRAWTKQVREIAYDSEDCIDIYWIRIRRPIPFLQWPRYQFQKVLLRRTLAADIRDLLDRITAVNECRARYGIDREELRRSACFAPVSAASVSARALRRADDPDQFVGIREEARTLAKAVSKNDDEHDRKLKVFSILGFGGLGKTTMAMEVCRQLVGDFQHQALVSVSQAFDGGKDTEGLLLRILQQIEPQNTSEMAAERLLKELLNEKRYLIVIDDVWSLQAWEAICIRLPKNNHGSRVIVTTRIETVAKAASGSDASVHQMKPLIAEASEILFLKTVFGSMEKHTCPSKLKETMDKILKKCGGLPLAIVSIASLLASYNSADSIEVWTRVSNSIGFQMENHPTLEGMRQLLSVSFDCLPHHLQACMLYLSIFPEDYVIEKVRLLYRWIAEGLVAEKRGLTLFEIAKDYYNDLVSRSMIIEHERTTLDTLHPYGSWKVETCQVHDMMLEVMVSKSVETNFVSLIGRQYGEMSHGKVRRLSIHGDCDTVKKVEQRRARHGIEAMELEHVRSLTTFQSEGGLSKLLDRLVEFKLLRVLDLQDCRALQNKHMRYVCRLYLLRFLSLRGTRISNMPNEIGDLEHLESLDVKNTAIAKLPQTVTKLTKLERLIAAYQWNFPQGIGNMKALREVEHAFIEGGKGIDAALEIGELQQLQVLTLKVDRGDIEFMRAVASSLKKLYSLRVLSLENQYSTPHQETKDIKEHISSLPPLLRSLTFPVTISRLPEWIPSLTHLVEFYAAVTDQSNEILDALCNLPNLQILILRLYHYAGQELLAGTTHNFPMLRSLNLFMSGENIESIGFGIGSMAKLEILELNLNFLKRSINFVGIENLKNLKEFKLRGGIDGESAQVAVEQVKTENENRTEFNQIKMVVEEW
ncbi:unnamed protein product [Alopecurus aequalis]